MSIDNKTLTELERLEKAATAGPWLPNNCGTPCIGGKGAYISLHSWNNEPLCLALRNSAAELIADSRKLRKLEEAARALTDRLAAIHEHPHYQSVWQLYMIHGGDYTNGPKYDKQLEALCEVLADCAAGPEERRP